MCVCALVAIISICWTLNVYWVYCSRTIVIFFSSLFFFMVLIQLFHIKDKILSFSWNYTMCGLSSYSHTEIITIYCYLGCLCVCSLRNTGITIAIMSVCTFVYGPNSIRHFSRGLCFLVVPGADSQYDCKRMYIFI